MNIDAYEAAGYESEFGLPPPVDLKHNRGSAASLPPTLSDYTALQVDDALKFLDLDTSDELGWRWKSLEGVIGPQLPQELLILAARPGNGKTTFAMNHTQYWIDAGKRVLYIGMEMSADMLRTQYAAWASNLTWKHVARRKWELLPANAKKLLKEHLWFQYVKLQENLFFAPDERLTIPALEGYLKELEDKHGQVDMVVIDHLHRMSFGSRASLTETMGEAVTRLKSLGVQHNTRLFVCAQLKRSMQSDVINDYLPSSADAIKQTGAAEQEANTILTLNRGMRPGITNALLQTVRKGLRPVSDIALPGVMNARVAKLRIDGDMKDVDVKLYMHDGRLYDTEAERNSRILESIRT